MCVWLCALCLIMCVCVWSVCVRSQLSDTMIFCNHLGEYKKDELLEAARWVPDSACSLLSSSSSRVLAFLCFFSPLLCDTPSCFFSLSCLFLPPPCSPVQGFAFSSCYLLFFSAPPLIICPFSSSSPISSSPLYSLPFSLFPLISSSYFFALVHLYQLSSFPLLPSSRLCHLPFLFSDPLLFSVSGPCLLFFFFRPLSPLSSLSCPPFPVFLLSHLFPVLPPLDFFHFL